MTLFEEAASALGVGKNRQPVGTVRIVDPNPLNWLYITYNTVEESIRVAPGGKAVPAAITAYHWTNPLTLELKIRENNVFADGTPVTSHSFKRAFDEMIQWRSPHPPGTHFNHDPGTTLDVTGEYSVTMHLPKPDGGAVGKLRAMHIMSDRFWNEIGFGYKRNGSGEGHW